MMTGGHHTTNPNNTLLKREIPCKSTIHLHQVLIPSKWVPFSDPCSICLQWILINPYCWSWRDFHSKNMSGSTAVKMQNAFIHLPQVSEKKIPPKKKMNIHHPYAYIFDPPVGLPNGWEFSGALEFGNPLGLVSTTRLEGIYISCMYIPRTHMTLVLLVSEGWPSKIEVIWALGIYLCIIILQIPDLTLSGHHFLYTSPLHNQLTKGTKLSPRIT